MSVPLLTLLLQRSVRHEYDLLFWSMVVICSSVGVAVAAFLFFFAWHYRRRSANELPAQVSNNIPVEATWIIAPSVAFLVMFLMGAKLYFRMERPPDNAEDIYVVAKQWMWKLQHTDGKREIDTLHVPVGRPIRLNMISEDAIHSFYVPEFRIKQDVLPDRYTQIWFKADKPGVYRLFCAEYCGTNHSQMTGWVYALGAKEYKAWLEHGAAEGSLASTGEKLFHQFGCSNCHHVDGHGRAPNLVGLYDTSVELQGGEHALADETYLRRSILQPKAQLVYGYQNDIMPTYQGQLSEQDVIALIAYIRAIGSQPLPEVPSGVTRDSLDYVNNPEPPPPGSRSTSETKPGAH